jgi:hypothetical protein
MADQHTFIFHLFRADGKSLILHPFRSPEKLAAALEQTIVTGRYGRDPSVESLSAFRAEVYRLIDASVRRWLADSRFIPKFLISAATFLVSYFFFSYVLRDPIPALNGVLALAAAAAAFILIGRRDVRSDAAGKRRQVLVEKADRIPFTESEFVKRAEQSLHRIEARALEEVAGEIVAPSLAELGAEDREEAIQFLGLLEILFDPRRLRREERLLRRLSAGSERGAGSEGVRELIGSRNIDLPLYAVYRSVKKSVAELKA